MPLTLSGSEAWSMTRTGRYIVAISGLVLALPAIFGVVSVVDISLAYSQLFNAPHDREALPIVSRLAEWFWQSLAARPPNVLPLECLGVVLHFLAFMVLLWQYLRQATLSLLLRCYCLLVLDGAVLELVRREWTHEDTFFWFGPLSGIHAAFLIVWLGSLAVIERRRRVAERA